LEASTNFGPVETYVMRVVCFYLVSVNLPHTAVYSVYGQVNMAITLSPGYWQMSVWASFAVSHNSTVFSSRQVTVWTNALC